MREIKFRAWDGKEMWTGFHILPEDIVVPLAYRKTKMPLIFMQFTGLHDKNGKEIYENDLLKYKDYAGNFYIGRVWYNESVARFFIDWEAPRENGDLPQPNSSLPQVIEIIGNIYEHSHLLKGEPSV